MRLSELASAAFKNATAGLVRTLFAYALGGVCALAAVVITTSASILALEPHVGSVYARLIVAGVFVLIGAGAVLWLHFGRRAPSPAPLSADSAADSEPRKQDARSAQIAMIVEAVMQGYSLSSRRSDR
jgi:type VI protein secretion system component VasK